MVCILEDPYEKRYETASKTAPTAKEMDMEWFTNFLLVISVLFLCLIPSVFSLHEFTSFPSLLMFKVSSKKLTVFTASMLCISLILSLILNYSKEVDNVVLIFACLMKSSNILG